MKKRFALTTILLAILVIFCYADMRSITYTTTSSNDLTIIIETNTRYLVHSMGVAFTNLATGTVTFVHTRAGYNVTLKSISISNVLSFVSYFSAPYVVDGKQGDTLILSTTNVGKVSKVFLTIER